MADQKKPDNAMPSSTTVYAKGSPELESANKSDALFIECEGDQVVSVPKSEASVPFVKSGEVFEYPAATLESLVRWAAKYGVEGKAKSKLVKPCIYPDFAFVATDKWDNDFYRHHICSPENRKYFLQTLNAAETFGMIGLVDFMSMCLGCILRSESEETLLTEIMGMEDTSSVTDDDRAAVSQQYTWFDKATEPSEVQ